MIVNMYILELIGLILFMVGSILWIDTIYLYNKGVQRKGKIIEVNRYYFSVNSSDVDSNVSSRILIKIEIEEDNGKIVIPYCAIDDYLKLQEGLELDVIYIKGKANTLQIYKEKNRYNFHIAIIIIGALITIVGLIV